MTKDQFIILKNIAEEGEVAFESYVSKHQSAPKDVYEILHTLQSKSILVITDTPGKYLIDNEKMISLLKPLALKYHDKTISDVYKLSEIIEVADLDFIKRLMSHEKVLATEAFSEEQKTAINRMLRDQFIIKCQNEYVLSLNEELTNVLIEKVMSDETQDDGFKKKYKEFADMSYEDVLKRFKKS